MQAILTRFRGPTNSHASRIIASCDAGRITVSSAYSGDEHARAALMLADKLGWGGTWAKGGLPNGTDCCFVCVKNSRKEGAKAKLMK